MTKGHAVKLAKLIYGNPDWIKSDVEFRYQPYVPIDYSTDVYEDFPECVFIKFKALTFGDRVDDIRIIIYANLNISVCITKKEHPYLDTLTVANQYETFKLLHSWGFIPKVR